MKKVISSSQAPAAIGPYSQAIEANGMVFLSGQLPVDPATGKFAEGGVAEQTHQSLKNILAILQEAGCDYSHIVKMTCLLSDMASFKAFNEVYAQYFPQNPPARSTFAVRELPLGALIEIEAIAVK